MMDLTIDEKMLILLYSPGTRMGLYGALQQMKEQLDEDETELLDLTNSVLQDVKELVSLLRRCSNNLNQYAKRANETGNIYESDIRDLQERLEEIWTDMKEVLVCLSSIQ